MKFITNFGLRQAGVSISPVAFATPRPSPARQEQIKVKGQRVTEPARQQDGFFDFFAGLGGAFQGLFGGAPLAESRAGGVRVTTGQAIEESADLFRQSAQPQNIFESAERLSRGELVGDVSLEQAFRESPLQDAPFGNFLQGFFR